MTRDDIHDVATHLSVYMRRLSDVNYSQYKLDQDACQHVANAIDMYVKTAFLDIPKSKQKPMITSITIVGGKLNA